LVSVSAALVIFCGPALAQSAGQLQAVLGERGLASLAYNGQEFLASPISGIVRPRNYTPRLQRGGNVIQGSSEPTRVIVDKDRSSIDYEYDWESITNIYVQKGNRLEFRLTIRNTEQDQAIKELDLNVAELTFPEVPAGRMLEAGMWGTGGGWQPLHQIPLVIAPDQAPPIIEIQQASTAIVFASDNPPNDKRIRWIGVPFTTDPNTKRSYPMQVAIAELAPNSTVSVTVSLRFGPSSADLDALAADALQRFRDTYPFELSWVSRAPIGAIFLATSQKHPDRNPRGWFLNAADVDVTTEAGLRIWHKRLMKLADDSIKILKDLGAQGMITWDPEGQEYATATFYGAPQLTSTLAPETDFASDGGISAMDEFFAKFRTAGLRTGVTLRPQRIVFRNGVPFQQQVDDPLNELLEKVRYARKRWGCTLFYIDSTYDKNGAPLSADIMRELAEKNPDVLFIPENKDFRYYAYTAPLNSFAHFGVASTPASIREVYKGAFSAILVTTSQDKLMAGREALIEALRKGDILIVNAWYPGVHTEFVKQIYEEVARGAPRRQPRQNNSLP